MIVGCERCSTQFQLDDARVPPDGVKVRCSRCKHAFVVHPAGGGPAEGEDPLHAIAERAAETDGIPGVTEDAPEASGPARSADPTLDDDDAPWEFGDGFDDLSRDPGDSGDALGLGDRAGATAEAPVDPSVRDLAEEEGDPEAVASALFDEADGPAPAAGPELDPAPKPRGAPAAAAAGKGDDLGSPMDWDLLDPEPGPGAAEAGSFAVEQVERPNRFTLGPEPADADGELDARQVWARRAGAAAGWLATAGLCVAGLLAGLTAAPRAPQAAPALADGWELEGVAGRWIDHLSRGPVFAVSGRVRNAAPSTRALPALEVVWRDRAGAAVGRPTPLAAPRLPVALREAPIDPVTPQSRSELAGTALRPGIGLDFEALAADLPYAAHHFEIEIRARRGGSPGSGS